jgi:hypothetical protein
MTHVRVMLERSGGFGGLSIEPRTLDSAAMTTESARELAELVEAAEGAADRVSPGRDVRDATRYDLTILREGRVLKLSFDDATMPPEVRPLVQRVAAEGTET